MTVTNFDQLGLAEPLLRALAAQNFTVATPIQAASIPVLLDGRDLMGIAQTGSGKTAAFALPLLHRLQAERIRPRPFCARALILAPTRELAVQIDETFRKLGAGLGLRTTLILGGVGRGGQVRAMSRGIDIVVGTPGRICDLMNTKELQLDMAQYLVLDEADRMLDMGFIKDIRRIIVTMPTGRQSLLFSATMPKEVGELAQTLLRNPVKVSVAVEAATMPKIEQFVHFMETGAKRSKLTDLLRDPEMNRVIVFTRTKRAADKVAEHLASDGFPVEAMHGNKSQNARQRSLERFRSGRARVLVATDVAARGIDVTGISHVVNFDLPNEPESYVHRIGRTARAGATGIALSFCDGSERGFLRAIEKLTGQPLKIASGTPPVETAPPRMGKPPQGGFRNNSQRPPANRNAGRPRRAA
ncbi:MAG: DEAD/DEAH box helicase [Rhodospirillales bacterium 20-60-12]|nr:MAG: DEAD/DEAH box helicase [Rhodospirillales bacterium 20-60-12]